MAAVALTAVIGTACTRSGASADPTTDTGNTADVSTTAPPDGSAPGSDPDAPTPTTTASAPSTSTTESTTPTRASTTTTTTTTTEPPPPPDVALDWSMAARYGLDRNGDGITDYGCEKNGDNCYEILPSSYTVTLDACSDAGDRAVSWTIDDVRHDDSACELSADLTEGTHQVEVAVVEAGTPVAGPTRHEVVVDDILIVAVGDSWTGGVGAPEVPGGSEAYDAWLSAVSQWLAAQDARAAADDALGDAIDALVDATRLLDSTDAAAEEAFDECFTTRFGVPVLRLTNFADCLDALAEIGVSFIDDVGRLDERIEESIDDAKRVAASAGRIVDNARSTADNAANSVSDALDALELRGDVAEGVYQHESCKRSANAGPAQLAGHVEDANDRTSVTFVHLSCSGSRSTDLIGDGDNDQIHKASTFSGERAVDLFLMGFGGNDVELNTILGDLCPRQPACHDPAPPSDVDDTARGLCGINQSTIIFDVEAKCTEIYEQALQSARDAGLVSHAPIDTSARAWFEQLFSGTQVIDSCDSDALRSTSQAHRYDCAARQINGSFGDRLPPERVVVWEYIDVAHGSDGALCPPGAPTGGEGNDSTRSLPGFTAPEIAFLDEIFFRMNGEIRGAADRHDWSFVATNRPSQRHGWCADDNWIARFDQWLFRAPGASALAHPTLSGMSYLGDELYSAVAPLLASS